MGFSILLFAMSKLIRQKRFDGKRFWLIAVAKVGIKVGPLYFFFSTPTWLYLTRKYGHAEMFKKKYKCHGPNSASIEHTHKF